MKSNPYYPMYGIGGYPLYPTMPSPNMIPPDKFKKDMMERLQPQIDQYGALYQQSQTQMQMQANSGMYVKVNSYDEVKAVNPPADGRPVMVFDEADGKIYSKRFENGEVFIKGFQLVDLEDKKEQKAEEKEEPDILTSILDKLDGFDKRLSAMEGSKDAGV